jgi:two-component system, LuxR family, sensor kinase FixL
MGLLSLGVLHLAVWLQQTKHFAYLLFSVFAASVAAIALCEWNTMLARTPEQYGRMMWWVHFPMFSGSLSLVGFVRLYFNAGATLAWLHGLRSEAIGRRYELFRGAAVEDEASTNQS